MKNKLSRAILACIYNGERLISDSEELIYDHYSTAMYLAIIAQEEIAKAFIFYLILKGTMDWDDAKTIIKIIKVSRYSPL